MSASKNTEQLSQFFSLFYVQVCFLCATRGIFFAHANFPHEYKSAGRGGDKGDERKKILQCHSNIKGWHI